MRCPPVALEGRQQGPLVERHAGKASTAAEADGLAETPF